MIQDTGADFAGRCATIKAFMAYRHVSRARLIDMLENDADWGIVLGYTETNVLYPTTWIARDWTFQLCATQARRCCVCAGCRSVRVHGGDVTEHDQLVCARGCLGSEYWGPTCPETSPFWYEWMFTELE